MRAHARAEARAHGLSYEKHYYSELKKEIDEGGVNTLASTVQGLQANDMSVERSMPPFVAMALPLALVPASSTMPFIAPDIQA